jgi:hypothetical protein
VGENRAFALARSEHGVLLAAIIALLVGGIVAAIIFPTAPGLRAARENGSLMAPSSEESFSDAFGAPGGPSSSLGADQAAGGSSRGNATPQPSPSPGTPKQPPGGDAPPPDDEGLLGLLPDLPIIPPPLLPPPAAARAVAVVAGAVR